MAVFLLYDLEVIPRGIGCFMVNGTGADTPRWAERLAELMGNLLAGSFGSSESDPSVGGGGFIYISAGLYLSMVVKNEGTCCLVSVCSEESQESTPGPSRVSPTLFHSRLPILNGASRGPWSTARIVKSFALPGATSYTLLLQ